METHGERWRGQPGPQEATTTGRGDVDPTGPLVPVAGSWQRRRAGAGRVALAAVLAVAILGGVAGAASSLADPGGDGPPEASEAVLGSAPVSRPVQTLPTVPVPVPTDGSTTAEPEGLPELGPDDLPSLEVVVEPDDLPLVPEVDGVGLGPDDMILVGGPVPPQPGVVHLTFDDGPHPTYTPAVLDVLARHGAKATFFVVGSQVEAHPDLVERILAEGHTLANHSWNHEDLATLHGAELEENIIKTQMLLGEHGTACLRPPFGSVGSDTRDVARSLGFELVLWDVDTLDWQKPRAGTITRRIVDGVLGGSGQGTVVLLHDGGGNRTGTVDGLDGALEVLVDRGFEFEPICVP